MVTTVLVTGATGRFGSIVPELVSRGHRVHAMTRAPHAPAADELRRTGAVVVPGDLDDPASLRAAMAGCDAVFGTGTLHRAGPAGELRHGTALADAAHAVGVPHLVYVSGADAMPGTGVPMLEVKAQVEAHLRALRLPCTVIAPVYLMENLLNPWNVDALHRGVVRTYVEPTRPVQQVPVADVVGFAVFALEHRSDLVGRRVEIASDAVNAIEMAAALNRVTGRRYEVEHASPEDLAPALGALFRWLERVGQHVDIGALRRSYPDVRWHTFGEWARTQFAETSCVHTDA